MVGGYRHRPSVQDEYHDQSVCGAGEPAVLSGLHESTGLVRSSILWHTIKPILMQLMHARK